MFMPPFFFPGMFDGDESSDDDEYDFWDEDDFEDTPSSSEFGGGGHRRGHRRCCGDEDEDGRSMISDCDSDDFDRDMDMILLCKKCPPGSQNEFHPKDWKNHAGWHKKQHRFKLSSPCGKKGDGEIQRAIVETNGKDGELMALGTTDLRSFLSSIVTSTQQKTTGGLSIGQELCTLIYEEGQKYTIGPYFHWYWKDRGEFSFCAGFKDATGKRNAPDVASTTGEEEDEYPSTDEDEKGEPREDVPVKAKPTTNLPYCQITCKDGCFVVSDPKGHSSGIFINGEKAQDGTILKFGDILSIVASGKEGSDFLFRERKLRKMIRVRGKNGRKVTFAFEPHKIEDEDDPASSSAEESGVVQGSAENEHLDTLKSSIANNPLVIESILKHTSFEELLDQKLVSKFWGLEVKKHLEKLTEVIFNFDITESDPLAVKNRALSQFFQYFQTFKNSSHVPKSWQIELPSFVAGNPDAKGLLLKNGKSGRKFFNDLRLYFGNDYPTTLYPEELKVTSTLIVPPQLETMKIILHRLAPFLRKLDLDMETVLNHSALSDVFPDSFQNLEELTLRFGGVVTMPSAIMAHVAAEDRPQFGDSKIWKSKLLLGAKNVTTLKLMTDSPTSDKEHLEIICSSDAASFANLKNFTMKFTTLEMLKWLAPYKKFQSLRSVTFLQLEGVDQYFCDVLHRFLSNNTKTLEELNISFKTKAGDKEKGIRLIVKFPEALPALKVLKVNIAVQKKMPEVDVTFGNDISINYNKHFPRLAILAVNPVLVKETDSSLYPCHPAELVPHWPEFKKFLRHFIPTADESEQVCHSVLVANFPTKFGITTNPFVLYAAKLFPNVKSADFEFVRGLSESDKRELKKKLGQQPKLGNGKGKNKKKNKQHRF